MASSHHPHVTVAALVEQDGRFLMVEERTSQGLQWNQPAGHWEPGETLAAACIRETREETAYPVVPVALVGIYHWVNRAAAQKVRAQETPAKASRTITLRTEETYLRFAFAATLAGAVLDTPLDHGIVRVAWLTPAEMHACASRHRSPLVLACLQDYLAGQRHSLDALRDGTVLPGEALDAPIYRIA